MKKNLKTASICVQGGYEAKNGEPIKLPLTTLQNSCLLPHLHIFSKLCTKTIYYPIFPDNPQPVYKFCPASTLPSPVTICAIECSTISETAFSV